MGDEAAGSGATTDESVRRALDDNRANWDGRGSGRVTSTGSTSRRTPWPMLATLRRGPAPTSPSSREMHDSPPR